MGLIALVILIIACVVMVKIISSVRADASGNISSSYGDRSWRVDNADGSFTIYDKHGAGTVVKTYEGGERYIDGHKCCTADDMARWYAKKGFGEGLERRLIEIEQQLQKLNDVGGDELLQEWDDRYEMYKNLCKEIGMWNWVIGDHATYGPTLAQLELEKSRRNQVAELHREWLCRMHENRIVLDYLEKAPRKHCLKNVLIKDLAGNNSEKRKKVQAIYRRLLRSNVIGEKKKENEEIETRIIVRRKKTNKKGTALPASTYHAEIYANIRKSDLYKVQYTVSSPEELDRDKNVCFFVSKSSGERYATSLERCTCPVYYRGHPCKHMLSLAISLGYFDPSKVDR